MLTNICIIHSCRYFNITIQTKVFLQTVYVNHWDTYQYALWHLSWQRRSHSGRTRTTHGLRSLELSWCTMVGWQRWYPFSFSSSFWPTSNSNHCFTSLAVSIMYIFITHLIDKYLQIHNSNFINIDFKICSIVAKNWCHLENRLASTLLDWNPFVIKFCNMNLQSLKNTF